MDGCSGECVEVEVWCPSCDRRRIHVRIDDDYGECRFCGELNEMPCEDDGGIQQPEN